ncbi:MAG: gliding motility-associated ABC transporter ATP-binding subunit GldA [Bacteroidales bacterium]|nr:gliding motility-associated ABC transporter ATP-binding subunit GldA [Bacteroidales bacterium]MDZ4203650.1 gliding motility-associated ABC transporter ATP-binding subunit GldA [Bacteroidales bacterium]
MSIKVEQITKIYSGQKALNNVSFHIQSGEIVGFLGPNGAGKSTMMKILTCFIPPTSGQAEVCGYDVQDKPMDVKKRIGYLPETNPLYPEMYVREYLQFLAGIHRLGIEATSRVEKMIEITGLAREQNKRLGQLSKGYRQRVGLAGALIHDPEVLILDEPTSGLDPNQIVDIRELIRQMREKKTVMLSTHILQEVEAMCSRVIIIDKGTVVADDSVVALSLPGLDNQTIVVEFDRPVVEKVLLKIKDAYRVVNLEGNTWQIITASDADIRQDIFKFAVDNGLSVLSMQKVNQTLENVFRQVTNK